VIPALVVLVSMLLHELAHGVVARAAGDVTATRAGRLTLNPLPHLDPVGSICVPLILGMLGAPIVAWAKPLPIDPLRMHRPRAGVVLALLAGPMANLILAAAAAAAGWPAAARLNLTLAAFNLLPIGPLDGRYLLIALRWLVRRALRQERIRSA
jgi:Zn-dependent protease